MASQTVSDFASTIYSVEKADDIAEKYSFPIDLEYRAPIGKTHNRTLQGAPSWKPNYLFVSAPDDVRMAWDYREAHEMGGVVDAWSKHDKARIERYRVDIDSLESVEDILGYTEVQRYVPPVRVEKRKDDEGSSNKVTKKRKLRRLVKASDAGAKAKKKKTPTLEGLEKQVEEQVSIEVARGEDPSKVTSPIIEEVGAPMPEGPVPETGPATERHPEWFRPLEASLEKKNVEDTDGLSSYTGAAAIYHFGDNRIECPITEDVEATLTEEESLKMVIFSSRVTSSRRQHDASVNVLYLLQLTTAMASILMCKKTLKRDIVSLQAERGFLEQERQSSEPSRKGEEALRLARE
ncbi:OLC1v1001601C1 [Oldenlandia corymbosa var. corymbosa]|uniref:OLC1v1001601C1 n=1 Tax=Oldenlandia corymbosa var. corymbosa TaxID=529605 RepID=A0AAV1D7X6_OLDCO|nr:OLC1v1001601C1 [Oldenlandia corymbosa var. corymbosa]